MTETPRIRNAYERVAVRKNFNKPSMAQQHMRDECNINNIMQRYQKTGILEHVNRFEGRYGDFVGAPGYQEAINQVIEAQEMFMSLPSSVRRHFDNDPAQLLAAAADPERRDELAALGLVSMPSHGAGEAGAEPASAGPAERSEAPAPKEDA